MLTLSSAVYSSVSVVLPIGEVEPLLLLVAEEDDLTCTEGMIMYHLTKCPMIQTQREREKERKSTDKLDNFQKI